MKKIFLIISLLTISFTAFAQDEVRIKADLTIKPDSVTATVTSKSYLFPNPHSMITLLVTKMSTSDTLFAYGSRDGVNWAKVDVRAYNGMASWVSFLTVPSEAKGTDDSNKRFLLYAPYERYIKIKKGTGSTSIIYHIESL